MLEEMRSCCCVHHHTHTKQALTQEAAPVDGGDPGGPKSFSKTLWNPSLPIPALLENRSTLQLSTFLPTAAQTLPAAMEPWACMSATCLNRVEVELKADLQPPPSSASRVDLDVLAWGAEEEEGVASAVSDGRWAGW